MYSLQFSLKMLHQRRRAIMRAATLFLLVLTMAATAQPQTTSKSRPKRAQSTHTARGKVVSRVTTAPACHETYACPGVFSNTQMNEYQMMLINGINPASEFHVGFPGNNATQGLTAGISFPASSTVFQGNVVAGYSSNASTLTNAVAGFFQARAAANGTHNWALNTVFMDGGLNAVTGASYEADCNINNLGTTGACIQINGSFSGTPNSYPALQIAKPGAGKWTTLISHGSAGADSASYFTSVDDDPPEPLNIDTGSSGNRYFTISDSGNLGMQSGFNAAGNIYWWFQVRNNRGNNNTAYPIVLNPLGGNVGVGVTNPGTALDVNGQGRFSGGVTQGAGGTPVTIHQHKRISTGSISPGTRKEVLLNWANTMNDTNYTVTCNVEDPASSAGTQGLTVERIRTKSATQVWAVVNNPTGTTVTGTLNCSADHD